MRCLLCHDILLLCFVGPNVENSMTTDGHCNFVQYCIFFVGYFLHFTDSSKISFQRYSQGLFATVIASEHKRQAVFFLLSTENVFYQMLKF